MPTMQRSTVIAGLVIASTLTGCAQIQLGAPVPSIENIQRAKAAGIVPVALGDFKLSPGRPLDLDQKVSVRSNSVFSPYGSSFARYLKETLATDLAAAGLLDPTSRSVIEAFLVDSQLDVPTGQAKGLVAARFVVNREGVKVYDKELSASASWQAPFVGVEAIPAAINEYGLLYRQLLTKLLQDDAFKSALKR